MMTSLPGIAGRSVGEGKPRGRILERVLCRGRIVNSKEWDWACLGGILWILLQARVCDASYFNWQCIGLYPPKNVAKLFSSESCLLTEDNRIFRNLFSLQ